MTHAHLPCSGRTAACSVCALGADWDEESHIGFCLPGHYAGVPVAYPPTPLLLSKTIGCRPASSIDLAAVSPAGPAPITATRFVASAISSGPLLGCRCLVQVKPVPMAAGGAPRMARLRL